jgi:hypothetical protein
LLLFSDDGLVLKFTLPVVLRVPTDVVDDEDEELFDEPEPPLPPPLVRVRKSDLINPVDPLCLTLDHPAGS